MQSNEENETRNVTPYIHKQINCQTFNMKMVSLTLRSIHILADGCAR